MDAGDAPLTTLPNMWDRLGFKEAGFANQSTGPSSRTASTTGGLLLPSPLRCCSWMPPDAVENNYPGLVVAGGGGGAPVSRVLGMSSVSRPWWIKTLPAH